MIDDITCVGCNIVTGTTSVHPLLSITVTGLEPALNPEIELEEEPL